MSRLGKSKLLGLSGDADEDESLVSFAVETTSLDPNSSKMPPAKRGRGRPAANKVTKPTTASARGRPAAKTTISAAAAEAAREALADKDANDTLVKPKRGRKPAQKQDVSVAETVQQSDLDGQDEQGTRIEAEAPQPKRRGRPARTAKDANTSVMSISSSAPARRGRQPAAASRLSDVSEVPETQAPAEDMDVDEVEPSIQQQEETFDAPVAKPTRYPSLSPVKRSSGHSDADANSAQLRRRLGDLTRKCETLEAKYRDLREVGVKEAEKNFDRLKKQNEQQAKAAETLIAELRDQLATQRALAKEGQEHKKKLDTSESRIAQLEASLAESRKEVGTLNTKLSASRSAEAAAAAAMPKIPGSAVKGGNAAASRAAAASSTQAIQTGQRKEDLYSDLTGLIIRGIKREGDEDVYDCIQTGRNGTLHFKLMVETEDACESYEEAQFSYVPQLDDNRDRDLIELLPEYLTEDIAFPRPHAPHFFSRITRSLTEKVD